MAVLDADSGKNKLCLTLVMSGVGPITSAHLHVGPTETNGPVAVAFPEEPAAAAAECVTVARQLINDMRQEPGNYYVEVHTATLPNGGLRGQLKQ